MTTSVRKKIGFIALACVATATVFTVAFKVAFAVAIWVLSDRSRSGS